MEVKRYDRMFYYYLPNNKIVVSKIVPSLLTDLSLDAAYCSREE